MKKEEIEALMRNRAAALAESRPYENQSSFERGHAAASKELSEMYPGFSHGK